MEFLNTESELRQINEIINEKYGDKLIKCEKVVNGYNIQFNEYKRQIIICSVNKFVKNQSGITNLFDDDYDIQYNNYIDISMCKNTIVGEYIYYAKNVNQYENIEEVCCSMYNMDYEQALDFFREISEIEWTKHILDEMFFH